MDKEDLRNSDVMEAGDAPELDERNENSVGVMRTLAEKTGGTRGNIVRAGLAFVFLTAATLAATLKAKFAKADGLDEEVLAAFMRGNAGSEQTLTAEELDVLTQHPLANATCEFVDTGMDNVINVTKVDENIHTLSVKPADNGHVRVYPLGSTTPLEFTIPGGDPIPDEPMRFERASDGTWYFRLNSADPDYDGVVTCEPDGTDCVPQAGTDNRAPYSLSLYELEGIMYWTNTGGGEQQFDVSGSPWVWQSIPGGLNGMTPDDAIFFHKVNNNFFAGSYINGSGNGYLEGFSYDGSTWTDTGDLSYIIPMDSGTLVGGIENDGNGGVYLTYGEAGNLQLYHCTNSCVPDTCADLGMECGVWDDGCGGQVNCGGDEVCADGLYCDGVETCNVGTGFCEDGTAIVCDDGAFCDGVEWCNEAADQCADGTDPCNVGTETCDEGADICEPIGDDDTTDDDTTDDDTTDDDTADDDTTDDDTTDDDTTDDDTADDDTADDDTADDDTADDDDVDDDDVDDDDVDDDTTADDDSTDKVTGDDDDDDGGCGC